MVAGAGVLDPLRLPGGLAKSRITDTFSPASVVLRDHWGNCFLNSTSIAASRNCPEEPPLFPPAPVQGHRSFQLTGSLPDFRSSSLVLEKCLHPKNPRYTDSGEGWAVCSTWWRFLSMALPFFWA